MSLAEGSPYFDVLYLAGGPELNTFEQFSSDDRLMSQAGGGSLFSEVLCGGGGSVPVQCIIGNGHMDPPVDRQT